MHPRIEHENICLKYGILAVRYMLWEGIFEACAQVLYAILCQRPMQYPRRWLNRPFPLPAASQYPRLSDVLGLS